MRKLSMWRGNRSRSRRNLRLDRAVPTYVETLEGRTMLSLLGVAPGYPQIFFDTTGKINYTYNATTQQGDFVATATPHTIEFAQGGASYSVGTGVDGRYFTINFLVSNTGSIISGQTGPNLIITGDLTDPNTNQVDNGVLLEGTISQFGYQYTGSTTNFFDFRFTTYAPNPGLLASYFAGDDIGVTMLSQGNTFKGNFATNWIGGGSNGAGADGQLGPIPQLPPPVGSLSGFVYEDLYDDGMLHGVDVPLSNIEVILTGTDYQGNPVDTISYTGGNGQYVFNNLAPSGPNGYTITEVQATVPPPLIEGTDSLGTLGGNASVQDVFSDIQLGAGQNGVLYEFGEIPPSSISGYVYYDVNNDGTQEAGEPGIGGATVTITGVNDLGQTVDETTTTLTSPDNSGDQVGYYDFTGLRPSPTGYTITETTPTGYNDGIDTPGTGFTLLSQSQDQFVVQPPLPLLPGGDVGTEYNFGNILGSISGTVWLDSNQDAVQENGEPDVSGVEVELLEGTTVVATGTTNNNGQFDFTGLLAGTYQVEVIPPTGEAFTTQTSYVNGGSIVNSVVSTSTGISPNIVLPAGANDTNVDAGLILGSISGTVWMDTNQNGIQDSGEPDVSGVTVNLLQGATVVASLTTDNNGYFDFTGLLAGTYQVQVVPPTGEAFTIQTSYVNGGSTINSVVNTATGASPNIVLPAGANDTNVDAGLILGSISGTVWMDTNQNGTQQTGEPDISGVTVELLQGTTVIATQTTNSNGYFDFTGLVAGTYQVQVIPPTGEAFTIQTAYVNGGTTINSVVSTSTGVSPNIVLPAGANDTNVDAGLILGSISGTVWMDTNQNGTQQTGEPDVSGVTVELLKGTTVVATTTTNSSGYFDFTGLVAGTYQVQVIPPTGEAFTIQTAYVNGGTTINSVVNTSTGASPSILLAAGQNDTNVDAGLILGSISGTVWMDTNQDGIQESGEPDVSGVTVELLQGTTVVATQTTNSNGFFDFTGLYAGTYQVQVIPPTGEAFTIQTSYVNGGSTINSVVNTGTGISPNIVLPAGANDTNVDAGLILGSISGTVWMDTNQDGIQESGEPDVSGVTVELLQGTTVVATTTTNSNGSFDFTGLVAGTYQVQVIPPTGEAFTIQTAYVNGGTTINSVVSTSTGVSPNIVLPAGANDTNVDAGLVLGSISGTVWMDTNQDGVQESGEADISGVTVELLQGTTVIATQTTNSNGYFDFTGLVAGTYQVQVIPPTGEAFTIQTAYVNGGSTINSVVSTSTGVSPNIVLPAGANDTNVDAGLILGSISGTVWMDTNQNGTQQTGEPDVSGVTVELLQGTTVVATTTTTNSNGSFDFTGLVAGTYQVQVIPPTGEAFTIQTAYVNGGTTINSVVNTSTGASPSILLAAGQNDTNVDAGLILGSISGTVWMDTNQNGTQQTGEPDISGVTVELLQGTTVIATQTTNSNGYFDFTGLVAGTYQVQVIPPTGEAFTIQTAYVNGGSTINSVVSTSTGVSPNIVLPAGANDTNVDAGLILGSISGTVWMDTNQNGTQQTGEPDVSGVTVELLQGTTVVATTTTNASGYFDFTGLVAGTYQVQVIPPTGEAFTIQTAYVNGGSTINSVVSASTGVSPNIVLPAGANDTNVDAGLILGSISGTVWMDTNQNGTQQTGEPDVSGVSVELLQGTTVIATQTTNSNGYFDFTGLVAGTYQVQVIPPTGEAFTIQTAYVNGGTTINSVVSTSTGVSPNIVLPAGANDTNVDAGLILGSISGTVWMDTNQNGTQQTGEPDVSGVTVELLKGTTVVATTTTNSSGYFDFTGLVAGTYQVQVIPPTGEAFTIQTAYVNGGTTINSVVSTSTGVSPNIMLPAGANDTNVDAGLILGSISGTVWMDTNQDGVQESGEPDVSGVTVELLQGTTVIATQTTNSSGYFDFTGLVAGTYQVQVIPPTGEAFTIQTSYVNGGSTINSVVSTSTGVSPNIVLPAGANDTNVDAGLILGSISGTVWMDTNQNGTQQTGEPDVSGVTVELLQGTTVVATTTTNGNGFFDFTSLLAGTYEVKVIPPTGEAFTIQTSYVNGGTTINSVVSTSTGVSPNIVLPAGANDTNVDAGLTLGSISGTVWEDTNKDGVQESGEPDLSGITVNLLQGTTVVATQTTNASGYFDFTGLLAGTYTIQVVAPTGLTFTVQTAYVNGGTTINSVVNTSNGLSPSIVLAAGQNDTNVDAGLIVAVTAPQNIDLNVTKTVCDVQQNCSITSCFNGTSICGGDNIWFNCNLSPTLPSGCTSVTYSFSDCQISFSCNGTKYCINAPNSCVTYSSTCTTATTTYNSSQQCWVTTCPISGLSGNEFLDGCDFQVPTCGLSGGISNVTWCGNLIASVPNCSAQWQWAAACYDQNFSSNYNNLGIKPCDSNTASCYLNSDHCGTPENYKGTDSCDGKSYLCGGATGGTGSNWTGSYSGTGSCNNLCTSTAQACEGDTVLYTVTVSNATGYATATGVVLSDVLPAGLTFVSSNPSQGSLNNGVWTVGTLASGGSATLQVYAKTTEYGVFVNTAAVTAANQPDVNPNPQASATLVVGSSLTGTAFIDTNGNGVLNTGEIGLAGVTVELIDSSGKVVLTTTSSSTGAYSFLGVAPGNYQVEFIAPTGDTIDNMNGSAPTNCGSNYGSASCNYSNSSYGYNFNYCGQSFNGWNGGSSNCGYTYTSCGGGSYSYTYCDSGQSNWGWGYSWGNSGWNCGGGNNNGGCGTSTYCSNGSNIATSCVTLVCGQTVSSFNVGVVLPPATISGNVFADVNDDGNFGSGNPGISNVLVTLTGTTTGGQKVSLTTYTASNGSYSFSGVAAGTYVLTETIPSGFTAANDSIGTVNAVTDGSLTSSTIISSISLAAGNSGVNFNFGLFKTGSALTCDDTATIGFWDNNSGQCLIDGLNGCSTSTALGNWLAASFGNLYGSLAGLTNSQVAAYYKTLFNVSGQKTSAQVMSTALALYVTDTTLAGGNIAASYGFAVSTYGTAFDTYNVGTQLSSYGGPTGNVDICTLLQFVDSVSSNGTIAGSNTALQNVIYTIFNTINNIGNV